MGAHCEQTSQLCLLSCVSLRLSLNEWQELKPRHNMLVCVCVSICLLGTTTREGAVGILRASCQNIPHCILFSRFTAGRFRWSWGSLTCSQFASV